MRRIANDRMSARILIFTDDSSLQEYPDYYEVIKKPINLEIISQKLKGNCYESLDDLISDFVLMFDNAFKYNEPDSQIYKVCIVAVPPSSNRIDFVIKILLGDFVLAGRVDTATSNAAN